MNYSRFTDRARKVMQLANQEAQRFNHEYIGTEHILLGLVKEGSGVAANVLKNLDIDLRKIRLEVEKIVQHGPGGPAFLKGRLPHTPRVQKVIDYSVEEARNLNHNYVGTEHLLLGLLREQEGVASQVLMNLGLKTEDVRAEVLNLLSPSVPTDPAERQTAPADEPQNGEDSTPVRPQRLTEEQLQAAHHLLRQLAEQKEQHVAAQAFEQAALCREQIVALERLMAWYEWFRRFP